MIKAENEVRLVSTDYPPPRHERETPIEPLNIVVKRSEVFRKMDLVISSTVEDKGFGSAQASSIKLVTC